MKKLRNTLLLITASLLIFATSCTKEGVGPSNNIPATFTTKIVVEKYTGEWCGGCPSAGTLFTNLEAQYPNQFIGVGIHAGSSHDRYKDKEACKTMYSHLNYKLRHPGMLSIGFPNVMFNRDYNPSNNRIINGYSNTKWADRFAEVVAQPASCGLSLVTKLENGNLKTTVRYYLKEALEGEYAITAYLVESNLDGSEQASANASYMHSHVLRELLTDKNGIAISNAASSAIEEIVLEEVDVSEYKEADLEVIAFIHKTGSDYMSQQIMNGQKVHAGQTQNFD
jgi:thiol-disulfide isomerase/thioredoxin